MKIIQNFSLIRILLALLVIVGFMSCQKQDDNPTPGTTGPCSDPAQYVFEEKDGLLIIETENATIPTGWVASNGVADFTGTGYIQWEGDNNFSKTGEGLINYKIRVSTAGTYRFQWRSRINEGTNATESNDAWLKFPDAADFFAVKNNSTIYPKGSGKTPNPEGGGGDGWFKVYMNQADRWSWQARTSDNDAHNIFVTFSAAGDYTIQLSGRSKGFAIDRMVLYLDTVNSTTATDANENESNIVCQ